MVAHSELMARVEAGQLIQSPDEVSEEYRYELIRMLSITADTEVMGAAIHYYNLYHQNVPDEYVSAVLALMQDELGHALAAYRLLQDLGVDTATVLFDRPPQAFRTPYAMDMIYDNFAESAMSAFLQDRAGFHLLGDVYHSTSYGPWKRALVKVDREERFHIRFGERAVSRLCETAEGKAQVQTALDWMFPITVEWFGLPDALKTHDKQIQFRLKAKSNDQLRREWLAEVVPLLEKLGLAVPAHYDADTREYVLDYPFPCKFCPDEKRWDFSQPVTWDEVLARWKGRGPGNAWLVQRLQSGRDGLRALGWDA